MVIAFLVAVILDNTVPGSRQERGVYVWSDAEGARREPAVSRDYELPFKFGKVFRWVKWVGLWCQWDRFWSTAMAGCTIIPSHDIINRVIFFQAKRMQAIHWAPGLYSYLSTYSDCGRLLEIGNAWNENGQFSRCNTWLAFVILNYICRSSVPQQFGMIFLIDCGSIEGNLVGRFKRLGILIWIFMYSILYQMWVVGGWWWSLSSFSVYMSPLRLYLVAVFSNIDQTTLWLKWVDVSVMYFTIKNVTIGKQNFEWRCEGLNIYIYS